MHKMTEKELFAMTEDERLAICNGECETKRCPFKKRLWPYREDGYCIVDTVRLAPKWINEIEFENKCLLEDIKYNKKEIKRYQKLMKEVEDGKNNLCES